jgi:hypothetical protein
MPMDRKGPMRGMEQENIMEQIAIISSVFLVAASAEQAA